MEIFSSVQNKIESLIHFLLDIFSDILPSVEKYSQNSFPNVSWGSFVPVKTSQKVIQKGSVYLATGVYDRPLFSDS